MPATNPQVPQQHPITVEEFFRMGETGVLAPETRIELIDGELIDIAGRTVMIHRDPQAEQASYAARFPLKPPGLIRPVMLPDMQLDLSALL